MRGNKIVVCQLLIVEAAETVQTPVEDTEGAVVPVTDLPLYVTPLSAETKGCSDRRTRMSACRCNPLDRRVSSQCDSLSLHSLI